MPFVTLGVLLVSSFCTFQVKLAEIADVAAVAIVKWSRIPLASLYATRWTTGEAQRSFKSWRTSWVGFRSQTQSTSRWGTRIRVGISRQWLTFTAHSLLSWKLIFVLCCFWGKFASGLRIPDRLSDRVISDSFNSLSPASDRVQPEIRIAALAAAGGTRVDPLDHRGLSAAWVYVICPTLKAQEQIEEHLRPPAVTVVGAAAVLEELVV